MGLFILLVIYVMVEPDEWAAERRGEISTKMSTVTALLETVNSRLPDLNEASTPKPCKSCGYSTTDFLPIFYSQIRQFKHGRFDADTTHRNEIWRTEIMDIIGENQGKPITKTNEFVLSDACDDFLKYKSLAILVPLYYQEPFMTDKDTFVQGEFEAWVVLFNMSGELMGYSRFHASSSEEVSAKGNFYVSDDDLKEKLREDFKNNIMKAISSTSYKMVQNK